MPLESDDTLWEPEDWKFDSIASRVLKLVEEAVWKIGNRDLWRTTLAELNQGNMPTDGKDLAELSGLLDDEFAIETDAEADLYPDMTLQAIIDLVRSMLPK